MEVCSAIELINRLVYKPGWTFTATDHTNRFEGSVRVRIDYPAPDSSIEHAPGYEKMIDTYASFPVICHGLDDVGLYRQVLSAICKIEEHEAREFLRVNPTLWAPFHPHRIDGMRRWGDEAGDLQFGIA